MEKRNIRLIDESALPDASLRYDTKLGSVPTTWTLGAENLFDKRYWKESPYQYGHVYLFPGAARTWRLAMQASF